VGPRAGMDGCGKSRPNRDSIPGPSSPLPVAIPTELPGRPTNQIVTEGYFRNICNLVVIRKLIFHHQKHLQATEFSSYVAANMLLKASRPRLVHCLRHRSYAASRNSNTVVTAVRHTQTQTKSFLKTVN
jgi:hypothetical protein